MKNIFKIHPLYYIVALITIFTGLFKDFIYITLLIFIHEIGHLIGALYYKWNIKKVVILPFGGITIFNELINKSLKEEFVILVLGPLFQILFYFILCIFNFESNLMTNYHYGLLLFNFIPIIPLDGSKLLNIILNKIFSFKLSHIISLFISLIYLIYLFIRTIIIKNLILFIILIFLLIKNIKEIYLHKYLFNKFLFERYNYNLKFKKIKRIKGLKIYKMKKDYKHLFYLNKYITENEILKDYFNI